MAQQRGGRRAARSETRLPRGRATTLVVGGLIALVAVVVVLVVVVSGGGGGKAASTSSPAATPSVPASSASHAATSPATLRVAVLNGTSTVGLAHQLSGTLQQDGYRRAAFLSPRPGGSHPVSTVEYASGHRADAQSVARALRVKQIVPMDSATRALSGGRPVIVVAGSDKATSAAAATGQPATSSPSGSGSAGAGAGSAGTGAPGQ